MNQNLSRKSKVIAKLIRTSFNSAPVKVIIKNRFILNYWKMRIKHVQIGKNLVIEKDIAVNNCGSIIIGDNVELAQGVHLATYVQQANISIGSNTFVARYSMICAFQNIEIGSHCMIAPFCYIADFNHNYDRTDIPMKYQQNKI